jgi:hypothetical protein
MSKPSGDVTFISYDQPALKDGVYKLEIKHDFQAGATDPAADIKPVVKHFAALGPRFSVEDAEIVRQFPPPKSLGRYYNVLPHISFSRSILPWERSLNTDDTIPWISLVLVTHAEIEKWQKGTQNDKLLKIQTQKIGKLLSDAAADTNIVFPQSLAYEPGETSETPVNYIDIPEPLLADILPKIESLAWSAHIRQSADQPTDGSVNPKMANVVCNRLPREGDENTVFLLSLENRTDVYAKLKAYQASKFATNPFADTIVYRFICLTKWSFGSVDVKQTFEELLEDADNQDKDNTGAVLRLPKTGDVKVDPFYEKGYVPLSHTARQGNRMVSWYRGPLLPGSGEARPQAWSAITSSDQLTRFLTDVGMFDVSYASAFELGRLLLLRNKRVSVALFNWKRSCAQETAKARGPKHLPFGKRRQSNDIPQIVADWFSQLGKLAHIPFNYLVPDERMLPEGSLRYFCVDQMWLHYLFKGAFGLGTITAGDQQQEEVLFQQVPKPADELSGFLLRSPVVSGWPHMQVAGFSWSPGNVNQGLPFSLDAPAGTDLTYHQMLLSPQILLGVFEGAAKMVEFFEQPETIHFGIRYEPIDTSQGIQSACFYKVLRDQNGDPYQVQFQEPCSTDIDKDYTAKWVRVPFQSADKRTIDLAELASRFEKALSAPQSLTPSQFAIEMIEGVPKVRFLLDN